MPFPDTFSWGVASASFQVEGSPDDDGRGESIWDRFCETQGKVFDAHTGQVACDSYQRLEEDIKLLKELGVKSYRLSLSWPRIMPDGRGELNEAGVRYYNQLIDALLANNIEPWVTLYHWDLPITLHDEGGWLNPDAPVWFEHYTKQVMELFSDRVSNWFTINEPQIFLGLGYKEGTHAPGFTLKTDEVLLATHHTLLAHGLSVRAIREHAKIKPRIGFAPVGNLAVPATSSDADVEAARTRSFEIPEEGWTYNYAWYCDPVFLGHYPEQGLSFFGADVPKHTDEELAIISEPLDMCGVNIYTASTVSAEDPRGEIKRPRGFPMTMFRWELVPSALYYGVKFLSERYKLPVVISENGLASMDWVHSDGKVHDAGRIDYLTRYLCELRRAIDDGFDVLGYFHWTLMDNFEWAEGYALRFGLVYMDYTALERIPKDSYAWYQGIIRSNGEQLPETVTPLR